MNTDDLWIASEKRMCELAHRAIYQKKLKPEEFVVVSIDVDTPQWKPLVDRLMPNEDWEPYRMVGAEPVAMGTVLMDGFKEDMKRNYPECPVFEMNFPERFVLGFVMGRDGFNVHLVEPSWGEIN